MLETELANGPVLADHAPDFLSAPAPVVALGDFSGKNLLPKRVASGIKRSRPFQ